MSQQAPCLATENHATIVIGPSGRGTIHVATCGYK